MIRHEATTDHKISVAAPKLNNNMTAAINNAKCEQDEAIIKTLKLVKSGSSFWTIMEKNRYQIDVNYRVKYKSYAILHVSGDF